MHNAKNQEIKWRDHLKIGTGGSCHFIFIITPCRHAAGELPHTNAYSHDCVLTIRSQASQAHDMKSIIVINLCTSLVYVEQQMKLQG